MKEPEKVKRFNAEVSDMNSSEQLKCVCKEPCVYWDDDGTLICNDCGEDV
jgi:hypothetical protein